VIRVEVRCGVPGCKRLTRTRRLEVVGDRVRVTVEEGTPVLGGRAGGPVTPDSTLDGFTLAVSCPHHRRTVLELTGDAIRAGLSRDPAAQVVVVLADVVPPNAPPMLGHITLQSKGRGR